MREILDIHVALFQDEVDQIIVKTVVDPMDSPKITSSKIIYRDGFSSLFDIVWKSMGNGIKDLYKTKGYMDKIAK